MESTIKELHNKVGKEMLKVLVFAVVPLVMLFIIREGANKYPPQRK